MAFLIERKQSPYWTLRYRDLETGKWRNKCLKLRRDDPRATIRANKEALKSTEKEKSIRRVIGENFVDWVPEYIRSHYKNPRSVLRYGYVWSTVGTFLKEFKIGHPREVKYEHAGLYLDWRKSGGASHNTARMEVKFLSFLLSEAIRREFLDRNVIALARIELEPASVKKELTDADIQAARRAFANDKDRPWMAVAFEILMNLGCRFTESRISRDRIDFEKRTIQIVDSKRQPTDPRKYFMVPLSESFAAFLKGIKWIDGYTLPDFTPPKDRTMGRDFNRVLYRATGATSHSCRVTFISRCHRAGLSEMEAMRLVNHSTRVVHRIYSRMNVEDARASLQRIPELPPLMQDTDGPTG